MSELVSDRIYNAQCLGNIEPVEYIVPYPNIFSLEFQAEGTFIMVGFREMMSFAEVTSQTEQEYPIFTLLQKSLSSRC